MPQKKIIAQWIELPAAYLAERVMQGPYKIWLHVNHCEYRDSGSKGLRLTRRIGVETIQVANKNDEEDQVREYAMRPYVRLLAKGIEVNDFRRLPTDQQDPSQDVIDGTAAIYQHKEEL